MEYIRGQNKNIVWISGGCGYGKTTFVDSIIIKEAIKGNKRVLKVDGKDFIDSLVKNIRDRNPIENFISHFQEYDLLILDDIDYALIDKPFTQGEVKKIIQRMGDNNKTKVILITQKRARKLRNLKINSDRCFYRRLKIPTAEVKKDLVKKWSELGGLKVSEEAINEIVNRSNNLFQLKGLFNQISFPAKYNK